MFDTCELVIAGKVTYKKDMISGTDLEKAVIPFIKDDDSKNKNLCKSCLPGCCRKLKSASLYLVYLAQCPYYLGFPVPSLGMFMVFFG